MDPNQQPQDFSKPDESPEIPTTPQTDSPEQSEFSQPEQAPVSEPATNDDTQAFGQPLEANQPPAPQPAFPAPQAAPAGQAPVQTGENPGQVLGIVSIVLSFLGLSIVGIILGVISRKKSKAANASTTLGTVGLILGIIGTVIGFLITISDFEKYKESTIPSDVDVNGSMYTNTAVTYVYCGPGAAQVVYLGKTTDDKVITALGTASKTEECPSSL